MTERAIDKMVVFLEGRYRTNVGYPSGHAWQTALEFARRLALADKEKPTNITTAMLKKGAEALERNYGITPTIYYTQMQVDMLLSAQKPTAPASLVEELAKFVTRLYDVRVDLYGPEVAAELVEILSRHEAEQGEGLREMCIHFKGDMPCGERELLKLGQCPDGFSLGQRCSRPTPTKPTEPLEPPLVMYPWNNEESEEWADIIMLREDAIKKYHLAKGATCKEQSFKDFCEAQEKYCKEWLRIYDHKSLFELAKKKGRKIAEGMFEIDVLCPDEGVYHTFFGPTYALAESKARAYLEALPDKGGSK